MQELIEIEYLIDHKRYDAFWLSGKGKVEPGERGSELKVWNHTWGVSLGDVVTHKSRTKIHIVQFFWCERKDFKEDVIHGFAEAVSLTHLDSY